MKLYAAWLMLLMLICLSGSLAAQTGVLPAAVSDAEIARATNKLSERIEAAQNLPIKLQTVSFQIPAGFQAQANPAVFFVPHLQPNTGERMPGAVEMLTVETLSQTETPAGMKNLRAELKRQLAEREKKYAGLGQLVSGLAAATTVILDRQVLLGRRWPALLFATATKISDDNSNGKGLFERNAYIFIARQTVVHLKYETASNESAISERFARFVTSFRPGNANFRDGDDKSNGWTRRTAGLVTVEVPNAMIPQRSFVYERAAKKESDASISDQDADKKVLRLQLIDPDDQTGLQAGERATDKTVNSQTSAIDNTYWRGALIPIANRGAELPSGETNPAEKYIQLRIAVQAADNTRLVLIGEGPNETDGELKNILFQWVQTFIPASGKHY